MNNSHITKEQLEAYHAGNLTREEETNMLVHIAECSHCSSLFAESFDHETLLTAPHDLESRIIKSSQSLDTIVTVKARHYSKQMQLVLYSLKVSAAVTASLLLLATTPVSMEPVNYQPEAAYEFQTGVTGWLDQKSDQIGELINQFSNHLLPLEGNNYD